MTDPVATADGHTYERGAIEKWLYTENKNTSPLTGAVLAHKILTPNLHFDAGTKILRESTLDETSLRRYFPKSAAFLNQRGKLKITKVNDNKVLNVFDLIEKIQECDGPATIQGLQKNQNAFTNTQKISFQINLKSTDEIW